MSRRRADLLVVEQGLATSRSRAQALILAGSVLAEQGRRVDKPGELLDEAVELRLRDQPIPYVSRGGIKLAAALDEFAIDPVGRVCLDVGASTGGFTDCLLQRGARRVYAVDVGYNQLAWTIRNDPRVIVKERCNIRALEAGDIPEPCELIVIDVSFISLEIVVPKAILHARAPYDLVCLVKPQFEVGRSDVGKGGIVRDAEARRAALKKLERLLDELEMQAIRSMVSPIRGAKGNTEYLLTGHVSG